MAYIHFDVKSNSIKILKGLISPNTEWYEVPSKSKLYSIIKDKEFNDFRGVKVQDYMSSLELKGFVAEAIFKDMMEKNNLPFLYVGQGPLGLEKSTVLKDKLNSKRPDFLVKLPDIGTLFFDVKCRKKIGFPNSTEKYFQLNISEILGLGNLHEQLMIPVWVAFVDESKLNDSLSGFPEFFIVPISTLKKYFEKLRESLNLREIEMLTSIRIPFELLIKIQDDFDFKIGRIVMDDLVAKNFAKNYKGLIRKIEDQIKNSIRTDKLLKTNLSKSLISQTGNFAFKHEVDKILTHLIKEGIIEYEPKKPLTLLGE